jgi:hypothetical protein
MACVLFTLRGFDFANLSYLTSGVTLYERDSERNSTMLQKAGVRGNACGRSL